MINDDDNDGDDGDNHGDDGEVGDDGEAGDDGEGRSGEGRPLNKETVFEVHEGHDKSLHVQQQIAQLSNAS